MKGINDYYRINSPEQVLESGLGTCIEQAMIEHLVFNKLGIKNVILVDYSVNNNNDKVKLHVFCAYELPNCSGCYYFEHSNTSRKGIHTYWDYYDLREKYIHNMNKNRVLTEISEIPVGYTLSEFREYVNTFTISEQEKDSNHKQLRRWI